MNEAKIAERVAASILKVAGTWALPKTPSDVAKIRGYLKKMERGEWPNGKPEQITDLFYNLIGDDELFDDLDGLERKVKGDDKSHLKQCAQVIRNRISDMVADGPKMWKRREEYDGLVELNR